MSAAGSSESPAKRRRDARSPPPLRSVRRPHADARTQMHLQQMLGPSRTRPQPAQTSERTRQRPQPSLPPPGTDVFVIDDNDSSDDIEIIETRPQTLPMPPLRRPRPSAPHAQIGAEPAVDLVRLLGDDMGDAAVHSNALRRTRRLRKTIVQRPWINTPVIDLSASSNTAPAPRGGPTNPTHIRSDDSDGNNTDESEEVVAAGPAGSPSHPSPISSNRIRPRPRRNHTQPSQTAFSTLIDLTNDDDDDMPPVSESVRAQSETSHGRQPPARPAQTSSPPMTQYSSSHTPESHASTLTAQPPSVSASSSAIQSAVNALPPLRVNAPPTTNASADLDQSQPNEAPVIILLASPVSDVPPDPLSDIDFDAVGQDPPPLQLAPPVIVVGPADPPPPQPTLPPPSAPQSFLTTEPQKHTTNKTLVNGRLRRSARGRRADNLDVAADSGAEASNPSGSDADMASRTSSSDADQSDSSESDLDDNERDERYVRGRVHLNQWWAGASLCAELRPGRGLRELDLRHRRQRERQILEVRGKKIEPDVPKRSLQALLASRESACCSSAMSQLKNTIETRTARRWTRAMAYKTGSGNVTCVQFSPDGDVLATTHNAFKDVYNRPGNFLCCDVSLRGWADGAREIVRMMTDPLSGTEGYAHFVPRSADGGGVRSATCSNLVFGGRRLVFTASVETPTVCAWQLETPNAAPLRLDAQDARLHGTNRPMNGVCELSYNNHLGLLSAASFDGGVYLWRKPDMEDDRTLLSPGAPTVLRRSAEIADDQSRLITTAMFGNGSTRDQLIVGYEQPHGSKTEPGEVRLWDVTQSSRPLRRFRTGLNAVSSVAWCEARSLLAAGVDGTGIATDLMDPALAGDRHLRLLDLSSGKSAEVHRLRTQLDSHEDVVFSPCARFMAVAGSTTVNSRTSSQPPSFVEVFDLRFLREAVATLSHAAMDTQKTLRYRMHMLRHGMSTDLAQNSSAYSVAKWTSQGLLITGGADWSARIWDVRRGDPHVGTLEDHDGGVVALDLSPDESSLAVACDTSQVTVYSLSDADVLRERFAAACAHQRRHPTGMSFPGL